MSHIIMSDDFLKRDIPVVITDGMDNWEAQQLFDVTFLNEVSKESYIHVCKLLSPTSDESKPLIGQLARVYDLVCRGKSCISG